MACFWPILSFYGAFSKGSPVSRPTAGRCDGLFGGAPELRLAGRALGCHHAAAGDLPPAPRPG